MMSKTATAVSIENSLASGNLVPADPVHFKIFPNKLPVTFKQQVKNKIKLKLLEKVWITSRIDF